MRFFSDSIYLQISDFEELKYFCKTVLFRLFAQDVFFKGAITAGQLDEEPVDINETTDSGNKIDIKGSVFGPSVVPVYYSHETYKGIGFIFEPANMKLSNAFSKFKEKHLISSIYPIANNRLTLEWKKYFDLKLDYKAINDLIADDQADMEEYEEGVSLILNVIHASMRAERSKKDLSRYYLSFLHSLIQNSDFSKISFSERTWYNVPIVFYVLQLMPAIRKGVLQIKGGRTLFLHMAEKALSTTREDGLALRDNPKGSATCDQFIFDLIRYKIIGKTYPPTPNFIFSEATRQFVAKNEIGLTLSGKPKRQT